MEIWYISLQKTLEFIITSPRYYICESLSHLMFSI